MKQFKNLVCASVMLLAASAQATVIVSEDFSYGDGGLNMQSGGTGWGVNVWFAANSSVSGGVAVGAQGAWDQAQKRNFAETLGTSAGATGTVWVRFDWGHSAAVGGGSGYGGLTFYTGTADGGSELFLFGNPWSGAATDGEWNISGGAGDQNTGISSAGMKSGVAKMDLGAGTVSLWVGATGSPVDVRGAADASVSGISLAGIQGIRINGYNGSASQTFDNLIIATTAIEVGAITYDTAFNSDTTGSWTNAANWTDGEPSASDSADILSGAVATLDAAANIKSLTVVGTATLDIANGGVLTASSDVTFAAGSTNRVGIGSGTSCGKLSVGGTLNVSGATLVINGTIDGAGRTIAVATNGIAGTFSNFGRGALVQSGTPNYYLHYVTNASPNYIVINQEHEWAADDFSYPDGGLNGQNGGTGFSSAWASSVNVGGGVVGGNAPSTRSFSPAFPSSGTLWVSFDWGYNSKPTEGGSYGGLTFYAGAQERFLIGNTWPGTGHDLWRMSNGGTTSELNYPFMKTAVAKITLGVGATSIVKLWVGPTGSPVDVGFPALATVTTANLEGVDGIRIMGWDGNEVQSAFDNFVIATTAAGVGAIDNPKGTKISFY